MSDYDFVLKRGDLLPIITATLTDAAGAVVDLTGAAGVKFILRQVSADTAKVNAAAAVVSAAAGEVSYTWVSADVDTPGVYYAEWQVTWTTGSKPQTYPNGGHQVVKIVGDLGS